MSVALPWSQRVLLAAAVRGPARAVLYALAARVDDAGETRVTQALLAEEAGVAPRTLRVALPELLHAGYLDGAPRRGAPQPLRLTIDEDGQPRRARPAEPPPTLPALLGPPPDPPPRGPLPRWIGEPPGAPPPLPPELDGARLLQVVGRMMVLETYYRILRRQGWEREDLAQEIALAVVAKQTGRSRYDRRRGSPEAYVRVVARSTLGKLLDRPQQPRAPGVEALTSDDVDRRHAREGHDRLHPWTRPAGWEPHSGSTRRRRAARERETGDAGGQNGNAAKSLK